MQSNETQNKKCPKCSKIDKTNFSTCRYCGTNYSALREQQTLRYATFGTRVWAHLLDGLIGIVLAVALVSIFPAMHKPKFELVVNGIGFFIGWMYYAVMESSSSQGTIGKMILGVRVTDINGQRISFLRATGRFFGKILSTLILYVGFLFPLFTSKKQTLHDMLAGCVVVHN
jgi:uncharacterized RDD family membrane protein YckC